MPMLSFFTYVVHAVSENHFKLGTWVVTKIQIRPVARVPRTTGRKGKKEAMGAPPPNPHENNKDSNPPCCPRSANNREGRMGAISPQAPNQGVGWSQWRDGSAVSFLQAANVALVRLT